MSRRFPCYLGDIYSYGGSGGAESVPGLATISSSYTLVDWLEPIFLSDNSQGEIGELRCIAHKHSEDLESFISEGQAIRIMDYGLDGADAEDPQPIFEGVVVKFHYVIQGNAEQAEVVAYNNADFLLHRICLHGQYRRTNEQENDLWNGASGPTESHSISGIDQLYHIDTPLVFNPDGLYNMSQDDWAVDGRSIGSTGAGDESCGFEKGMRIFEVPGRHHITEGSTGDDGLLIKAEPWTLGKAIQYLMTTTAADWAIDPNSWSAASLNNVFCVHGDPVISNVNLEGKSLGQALTELLEPYNYGFTISSIPSGTPALQTLEFFYRGEGESASVALSPRGTGASESVANLISADIQVDATPIINSVTSYGDQIVFTTLAHSNPPSVGMGQPPALKLEKGWKDDDLQWTFDSNGKVNIWATEFRKQYVNAVNLISKLGSDEDGYHYPYGVGRHWVVNLGEQPAANLADLTPALNDNANGVNSIDPRNFEKPEIFDRNSAGGFLHKEEIQVEMSYDNGTHWAVVDKSYYQIGTEGMSVTFVEPHLEKLGLKFLHSGFPAGINYWDALHLATIQIRVLCGVKSDERLAEQTTNDGAAFPLAVERIYTNQGYKKYKYNNLINDSVYVTSYAPVRAGNDDRSALNAVNQQHLSNTNRKMIHGELRCVLGDFRAFKPGQVVNAISNRFTYTTAPTILRVIYDFPSQHVRLILDNKYCKTVIGTKRLSGADRQQHHVGVNNPTQQTGQQVPFVPGSRGSWMRSIQAGFEGEEAE